MSDELFSRQPGIVVVTLLGDQRDIDYWLRELMNRAEFKGDVASRTSINSFSIYPRAVND
jgi:hypothetical protein